VVGEGELSGCEVWFFMRVGNGMFAWKRGNLGRPLRIIYVLRVRD